MASWFHLGHKVDHGSSVNEQLAILLPPIPFAAPWCILFKQPSKIRVINVSPVLLTTLFKSCLITLIFITALWSDGVASLYGAWILILKCLLMQGTQPKTCETTFFFFFFWLVGIILLFVRSKQNYCWCQLEWWVLSTREKSVSGQTP